MKSFKEFLNEQSYKMVPNSLIRVKYLDDHIDKFLMDNNAKILHEYKLDNYKVLMIDMDKALALVCLDKNIIVSVIVYGSVKIMGRVVPSVWYSKTKNNYTGNNIGFRMYTMIVEYYGCVSNDRLNTEASIHIYKKLSKIYDVYVVDLYKQEMYKLKDKFNTDIEKLAWVPKDQIRTFKDFYEAEHYRIVICK